MFLFTTLRADDLTISDVLMSEVQGCKIEGKNEFGRYIGDWLIEDEGLQQDGKTWKAGNGARWLFTCVGNGIAVQDFWMPNGKDGGPAPGVGTNLRIYDAEQKHWDITWTATQTQNHSHIRAKRDENDNIIMHYVSPKQRPLRRITFFPPTKKGWNWKMEISSDDGVNWLEVYRIKATAKQ
jgi:hypothetical protein